MDIRANRDILYFDIDFHNFFKFFKDKLAKTNLETPLHTYILQNREYPCLFLKKASFTIEAAFCGTLFFLALFSMLFLFRVLSGYEKQLLDLDTAVKEYECFGTKFSTIKELTEGGILSWDDENGVCSLRTRKAIPFLGGRMFSLSLYQQLCTNSYEGRSMIPEKEEDLEYVYLAEHGTVFHRNRECTYLKPDIRQITYKEVLKKRNHSGAKYYACKICGKVKGAAERNLVYITPYGDSWHTAKDCPGLKRTIREVSLSAIGNLPACSKCGG